MEDLRGGITDRTLFGYLNGDENAPATEESSGSNNAGKRRPCEFLPLRVAWRGYLLTQGIRTYKVRLSVGTHRVGTPPLWSTWDRGELWDM